MVVCLKDGMRGRYISLPPTSIQITQTDMQVMKDSLNKNEELLHGNILDSL